METLFPFIGYTKLIDLKTLMHHNNSAPNLILSTAYFPPLEYFVELINAREVVTDIHETYPKQTWRNRCAIVSGNGPVNLSIPVEKPHGNATKTCDIVISKHYPWRINHWRTIHSAYRNAPFFIYYADLIEQLIMDSGPNMLYELNDTILRALLAELQLEASITFSREFVREPEGMKDRRFCISPKQKDRHGYEAPVFQPYYQVFGDRFGFIPNLSIVDLIFNFGPDTALYLKQTEL
ncbi:MAG: hypothetical protein EA361_08120 [Bacteroidetes bacterium]|nr:MAG: hypothetical protein EA361_08120 [Bacteroidota bacterium]